MVFNVAKIASARASSTISLTKSLRVAGPEGGWRKHGKLAREGRRDRFREMPKETAVAVLIVAPRSGDLERTIVIPLVRLYAHSSIDNVKRMPEDRHEIPVTVMLEIPCDYLVRWRLIAHPGYHFQRTCADWSHHKAVNYLMIDRYSITGQ